MVKRLRLWQAGTFLVALFAAAACLLAIAPLARADTVDLRVIDAGGRVDPVQDIARTFEFNVASGSNSYLFVKFRPSGGPGCAPTAASDSGDELVSYAKVAAGSQIVTKVETFDDDGPHIFCSWLGAGTDSATLTSSQVVIFRRPSASIRFEGSPRTLGVDSPAKLLFSGRSEAPRQLLVKVRRTGGAGCAPTADSDSGEYLFYDSVNGSFDFTRVVKYSEKGSYTVCTWIARNSSDTEPVISPKRFTFFVGTRAVVTAPRPKVASPQRMTDVDVRLAASISGDAILVKRLLVTGAPNGSTVTIKCAVGCKYTETLAVGSSGSVTSSMASGKRLSKGSTLRVFVTKTAWIGFYARLLVDPQPAKGQLTRRQEACLPSTRELVPISCP